MKSVFSFLMLLAVNTQAAVTVKEVTELDNIQAYSPLTFHAKALWTATSKTEGEKTVYDLVAFDANGARLGATRLPHTIEHVYPFGETAVLAIGKSSWPWFTHYSIAILNGGKLTAKTTTFPEGIQTEQFGGVPGRMFFNNVGDREVFQWNEKNKGATPLKHEVSGPGHLVLFNDFLFVLERRSFQLGDEDIYRINLKTGEGVRAFNAHRAGITQLLPLPASNLIAASEGLADQLLLIDASSNQLKHTVKIPGGTPRGLAALGRCVVVGSDVNKKVTFVDVAAAEPKVVAEWDLASYEKPFFNLFSVAVDPKTGNVFGRAKDICASCTVTRNRVLVASDGGDTAKACGAL